MAQIHLVKTSPATLAVANAEAAEVLSRLKVGVWLNCEIRQARNYLFHKRFFALLNLGFQYWTPAAGAVTEPEKQLLRGYVDYLILMTGQQNILDETLDVWLARAGHQRADGVVLVKSFEAYRKWAVMTAGFYDEFILPDGTIRREARSISFASMSEEEFRQVYKAVLNVLWLYILNRLRKQKMLQLSFGSMQREKTLLHLLRRTGNAALRWPSGLSPEPASAGMHITVRTLDLRCADVPPVRDPPKHGAHLPASRRMHC